MTLGEEYFDRIYAEAEDPWGFTDRWYEQRKRAITLALLPEPRYATAYEPACSIGVLTLELAARCDRLLATDVSAAAVKTAAARTRHLPNVTVRRGAVPADWPSGGFDLVVLSEFVYYFDARSAREVADTAVQSTRHTLVAVHWRHPVDDYPLPGDMAQEIVDAAAETGGLTRAGSYLDRDLAAAVWTRGPASVAELGGLGAPG